MDVLANLGVARDVSIDHVLHDDRAAFNERGGAKGFEDARDGAGGRRDGIGEVAAVIDHEADHFSDGVLANVTLETLPDALRGWGLGVSGHHCLFLRWKMNSGEWLSDLVSVLGSGRRADEKRHENEHHDGNGVHQIRIEQQRGDTFVETVKT